MKRKVPLGVVFCLVPTFLNATIRQYGFMLKGLQEVEKRLARLNIPFSLLLGSPEQQIPLFIRDCKFGALVTDFDPLRLKREWKEAVAEQIAGPIYEVDGVVHYCVANMPGAVAKTSALALTNATLPYAVEIANKGWEKALKENQEIKLGANVIKGKVTCKGVADAFGLEYTPVDDIL